MMICEWCGELVDTLGPCDDCCEALDATLELSLETQRRSNGDTESSESRRPERT